MGTLCIFLFFIATATTGIYTLSLHDALPIFARHREPERLPFVGDYGIMPVVSGAKPGRPSHLVYVRSFDDGNIWRLTTRSEEHTSELQSLAYLVCRLLLEKKNKLTINIPLL